MSTIKNAINRFITFHKGLVNIFSHIVGFVGLFYSIYKLDWILFGVSIVILETGHVYNHVTGIEPYDFRPKVLFWRVTVFIAVIMVFLFISRYLI
jgi:hypothetical protein